MRITIGRIIGALLCLGAAAVLLVLLLNKPEGYVVFMIGDTNRPWVPIAGLAVLGVALLIPTRRR